MPKLDSELNLFVIALGLLIYLLPGFLASWRKHRFSPAIWIATLLLGWTFIGWVMALLWALGPNEPLFLKFCTHCKRAMPQEARFCHRRNCGKEQIDTPRLDGSRLYHRLWRRLVGSTIIQIYVVRAFGFPGVFLSILSALGLLLLIDFSIDAAYRLPPEASLEEYEFAQGVITRVFQARGVRFGHPQGIIVYTAEGDTLRFYGGPEIVPRRWLGKQVSLYARTPVGIFGRKTPRLLYLKEGMTVLYDAYDTYAERVYRRGLVMYFYWGALLVFLTSTTLTYFVYRTRNPN